MRSATLAEWIFARFTTRSRASSITGDLLESVPQKGVLWFWMSVARVVLSLTWRRSIAFLGAASFLWIGSWLVVRRVINLILYHQLIAWTWELRLLSQAGIILFVGLVYAAIRYGSRDLLVRHVFATWILIALALAAYRVMPPVDVACLALGVCLLIYSAMSARRRKGLFALTLALAFSAGWTRLSSRLIVLLSSAYRRHTPPITRPSHLYILVYFVGVLGMTFIFSKVHRLFFERTTRSDQGDSLGSAQVSPANS
ncbi:MAG TPA: hypothetical protein VLV89_01020 [Candidatus Acidoferrum sp.]|nr:hypothetical protein [Candidatus Acidoferrum sp.]